MLSIVAALKEEMAGLKKVTVVEESAAENGCCIARGRLGGREVLLAQTGVGRERAESAARFILGKYPVSGFISFGFGGGLTPDSAIGDVFICTSLYCDGQPGSFRSAPELLAATARVLVNGTVRPGKSVTVARPAPHPEVKQELARAFQADVVDMESYWLAMIAEEKRVPFLNIRAVSDTARESLPPFSRMLDADGRPRWAKAVPYLILHPGQVLPLTRLFRNSRRAGENLTALLVRLVEQLS